MDDIVERLRDWPRMTPVACKEAADEIERLRAEVKRLQDALIEAAEMVVETEINNVSNRS